MKHAQYRDQVSNKATAGQQTQSAQGHSKDGPITLSGEGVAHSIPLF